MIVTLLEPQIPPNTGTIGRLCAASNTRLEIVGKLGFELSDKTLKRAGLDYWEFLDWEYYPDMDDYMKKIDPSRIHLLSKKVSTPYTEHTFKKDDYLLFGSEITGIPEHYLEEFANQSCTIPMPNPNIRSLNLSISVGIVLYESLRQTV